MLVFAMTKIQFRALCKRILNKNRGWDIRDHKITAHLKKMLQGTRAVLLFCPLPHEPDIRPLIIWARRHKIKVFVPILHHNLLKPTPYRLPLSKRCYKIYEPSPSLVAAKFDLAIVPVLGVDGAGRRIGFGKGYYDTFFAHKKSVKLIFIARKILRTKSLLGANHDIVSARCIDGRIPNTYKRFINAKYFHNYLTPLSFDSNFKHLS
ncbi:5-formyltetrahydrofolate cyclo-ligase [Helicobacter cynogastricus]|uniref:5-formyltetrahydrofolate cyclo-ligase n=1 Tax=Helicobacter cynogastricus TaxID=329937 RepID=UPI000CF0B14D|nr:5-formyltetrahydrofolate cyclo-ligase [Helicobacter cynogastricus]